MSFKKNKYKIIKSPLSAEMIRFIYDYFLLKRKVAQTFIEQKYISGFTTEWGVWGDTQIKETYSHYADIVMECLLDKLVPVMEKNTGLKLVPTYSYARIYKKGDELLRHKDRKSCAVSATMFLGGDPWAIFIDPTGNRGAKGISVKQKPGDILIYSGCDLEHWREPLKGKSHCQVFLHYNEKNSSELKYDKREHLGLPEYFRNVYFEEGKKTHWWDEASQSWRDAVEKDPFKDD
jgi:hypothetical protein